VGLWLDRVRNAVESDEHASGYQQHGANELVRRTEEHRHSGSCGKEWRYPRPCPAHGNRSLHTDDGAEEPKNEDWAVCSWRRRRSENPTNSGQPDPDSDNE
jgi:hypothetical protein